MAVNNLNSQRAIIFLCLLALSCASLFSFLAILNCLVANSLVSYQDMSKMEVGEATVSGL